MLYCHSVEAFRYRVRSNRLMSGRLSPPVRSTKLRREEKQFTVAMTKVSISTRVGEIENLSRTHLKKVEEKLD